MQGLSGSADYVEYQHWGVLTIGTGLGNARFSNRLSGRRERRGRGRGLTSSRSNSSPPLSGAERTTHAGRLLHIQRLAGEKQRLLHRLGQLLPGGTAAHARVTVGAAANKDRSASGANTPPRASSDNRGACRRSALTLANAGLNTSSVPRPMSFIAFGPPLHAMSIGARTGKDVPERWKRCLPAHGRMRHRDVGRRRSRTRTASRNTAPASPPGP